MSAPITEDQLLFAVFVTKKGYATPDQVAKAASTALVDRSRTLGEQLESDGAISKKERIIIERMVQKALSDRFDTIAEAPISSDGPVEMDESDEGIGKVTVEQAGRYTMQGVHGRGGQARVMRAYDEHVGRIVALKEMTPDKDDPETWNTSQWSSPRSVPGVVRFLREARVTGQLEHPNIVPVYEVGRRHDGRLYYTMRLVRGETLADKLAACRTLKDRMKLLGVFWDICNAIAYAHSRGVVHRDVKPSNVMAGEFGETVLLDWGIAKVQGKRDIGAHELERDLEGIQDGDVAKTSEGSAIGTPSYMSPEQARGEIDDIDERSDIWGLGAVLYEILTGRPPFVGKSRVEIVIKVGRKTVPPVAEVCPSAPAELAAIAQKTLQRSKKSRYQTAQALAEDMNAYMTGSRVGAYEYSAWELLKRFASQHKTAIGAVVVILAVIIGALVFVTFSYRAEHIARQNESLARQEEAAAREKEHEERLVANFHLAQAYAEKADRQLADMRFLSANILASASLDHNPSHPKSPFFSQGFVDRFPQSHDLRVKAASQIYRSSFHQSATLDASFIAEEVLTRPAFSPDGHRLAVGSFDHSVRVWDLRTRKLVHTLQGHSDKVLDVAFSPDGALLASGGDDGRVIVWDATTGRIRKRMLGHAGSVQCVAFSSDGRLLGSASWDGAVRIRESVTGTPRFVLMGHVGKVNALAFSSTGGLLATAGEDKTVRVWKPPRRKPVMMFDESDGAVYATTFSPDGRLLAAAGDDQVVRIWSIRQRQIVRRLKGHTDGITRLSFSPNGLTLASASYDRTVRLWDVRTGALLLTIDGHRNFVYGVAFSPDGEKLASAGYDKTVKLWNMKPGRDMQVLRGHRGTVYAVSFSRDGKLVASGGWDKSVKVWDARRGRELFTLRGHEDVVDDLAISHDATRLATASRDKTVRIWNLIKRRPIVVLRGHDDEVFGVAFSPDGELLASAGADKTVRIWDLESGKAVLKLEGHKDQVDKLAFSPDSRRLASAGYDRTVRIWDPRTGNLVRVLGGHRDWISGVDFSSTGNLLASSGKDGIAIIWNPETGKERVRLSGHSQWVNSVRFSPDDKLVATASDDRTVRIWSVDTGRQLLKIPATREVVAIGFSPEGNLLVVGDADTVKLYPMDFSALDANPKELLLAAEGAAGMKLFGFDLNVAGETGPSP